MTQSFTDVVELLNGGATANLLTHLIQGMALRCDRSGLMGTITLQIRIKPGKFSRAVVVDVIRTKEPGLKSLRVSTLDTQLFIADDGSMSREDPRQMTLDGIPTSNEFFNEGKQHGINQ